MNKTKKSQAGSLLGKLGASARMKALSPLRRSQIAQKAARKRWGNRNPW